MSEPPKHRLALTETARERSSASPRRLRASAPAEYVRRTATCIGSSL
jgi:hypothetical protein